MKTYEKKNELILKIFLNRDFYSGNLQVSLLEQFPE